MTPTRVVPAIEERKFRGQKEFESLTDKDIWYMYTETWLYRALSPLILSMKVMGILHCRWCQSSNTLPCGNMANTTKRRQAALSQVYSVIVVTMVVINALRSLLIFNEPITVGPDLISNVVSVFWYFSCATNSLVCFWACHNVNCLPKIFALSEMIPNNNEKSYRQKFCRKRAYIYTAIGWILIAFNVGGLIYTIKTTKLFSVFITPFSSSSDYYNVIAGVYVVMQLYLSALWILPAGLHLVLSTSIYLEFKGFNKHLEEQLRVCSADGRNPNFERLRMEHNQICTMVEHADFFLSPYSGFTLLQSCVNICMLLFYIISYESTRSNALLLVLTLHWIVCILTNLAFLSIGGALINDEVS